MSTLEMVTRRQVETMREGMRAEKIFQRANVPHTEKNPPRRLLKLSLEPKGKDIINEIKEYMKGNHHYILSISDGVPREREPFKRTMNRKITKLTIINKEKKETSTDRLERPIAKLLDNEKEKEILNEIFPPLITATIANFDVS